MDEDTDAEIEYALIEGNREKLAELFVGLVEGKKMKQSVYKDMDEVTKEAQEAARRGKKGDTRGIGNRKNSGAFVLKAFGGRK